MKTETFEGTVDKVEGDIAHVTITSVETGEKFWCEFDANRLREFGIVGHRKFVYKVTEEFTPVPLKEVDYEKINEILDHAFPPGSLDEPRSD